MKDGDIYKVEIEMHGDILRAVAARGRQDLEIYLRSEFEAHFEGVMYHLTKEWPAGAR